MVDDNFNVMWIENEIAHENAVKKTGCYIKYESSRDYPHPIQNATCNPNTTSQFTGNRIKYVKFDCFSPSFKTLIIKSFKSQIDYKITQLFKSETQNMSDCEVLR